MRALFLACLTLSCGRGAAPAECPPCPPASGAAEAKPAGIAAVAARVLELLKAGDAAGLHALFNADLKAHAPQAELGPTLAQLVEQRGAFQSIEPIEVEGNRAVYRLRTERGEWRMEMELDDAGAIGLLSLKKPTDTGKEPQVTRNQVEIGLPFRGEWFVAWGGDTKELNYHVESGGDQRRAADLFAVDAGGKTHRGDGKRNQDYFAYGRDILAVADGVVVLAVDGVPDNTPGEMDREFVPGNVVIIEHRPDLYSMSGHLVPGSVRVKAGARVRRGQVLGACGNSGNSSEPHLHFQLQDGPTMNKSFGIEPVFRSVEVTRDGKRARVTDYTWRKGDRVHAP